jgi:hypothetical protein
MIDLPQGMPPLAYQHLPALVEEQRRLWPAMPLPSALASTVEQETCITLKHRRCWSPRAELKTRREYGVGLGQVTVAYHADGSERFNVWRDLRIKHRQELAGWTWENRYEARYQLRALVLKEKAGHAAVAKHGATVLDGIAFMANAYNAGPGMLAKSRAACARTAGCDPSRWFGHVEKVGGPAKVAIKGYSKSFFEISRDYVRNVAVVRRQRYVFMDGDK